jgi:serine/threonine protein kinase
LFLFQTLLVYFIYFKRNIFLTNDEKHIKIGDLGLARSLSNGTASLLSTQIGTLKYMSPEMRAEKAYSYNTDVWWDNE